MGVIYKQKLSEDTHIEPTDQQTRTNETTKMPKTKREVSILQKKSVSWDDAKDAKRRR